MQTMMAYLLPIQSAIEAPPSVPKIALCRSLSVRRKTWQTSNRHLYRVWSPSDGTLPDVVDDILTLIVRSEVFAKFGYAEYCARRLVLKGDEQHDPGSVE